MTGLLFPQDEEREPALFGEELEQRSPATTIIAIVCALALTGALLAGYFALRRYYGDLLATPATTRSEAESAPVVVEAQIYADDVIVRGTQALIGGRVENISAQRLEGLSVEIELVARTGVTERRTLEVSPRDLAPGESGRYSLVLPARGWSSAQLVRLHSSAREPEVVFNSTQGARRPAEAPAGDNSRVVERPSQGNNGFLNTPDNPISVP